MYWVKTAVQVPQRDSHARPAEKHGRGVAATGHKIHPGPRAPAAPRRPGQTFGRSGALLGLSSAREAVLDRVRGAPVFYNLHPAQIRRLSHAHLRMTRGRGGEIEYGAFALSTTPAGHMDKTTFSLTQCCQARRYSFRQTNQHEDQTLFGYDRHSFLKVIPYITRQA